MGLNFRKSISLGKGLRLNLGGKSASISFGKRGARYSVSTTGKRRATVGLPGTGLSYTKTFGSKKGEKDKEREKSSKEAEEALRAYEEQVEEVKSIHQVGVDPIDWNRQETVPRKLRDLAEAVLQGSTDAYYEVIEQTEPFEDLVLYGSEFEIGTDKSDVIVSEFNIKEEEVIPTTEVTVSASGKVTEKELSKTAYYELMQDYVCSVTIRLARDLFALLPVQKVIVHAIDHRLNTATGHSEEVALLSVIFTRDAFMRLNLDAIDPSDALENFEHNMKFMKTQGFKPIVKLEDW